MSKDWILIDRSKNVLLINGDEIIEDLETKEYISKNLKNVIRHKTLKDLDKTIHKILGDKENE